MEWITANWAEITAVVLIVVRIAESVIQATVTDKDDKIWEVVKKVISIFFKLS